MNSIIYRIYVFEYRRRRKYNSIKVNISVNETPELQWEEMEMKKKAISILLATALMIGMAGIPVKSTSIGILRVQAADVVELKKPQIETDASMEAGQKVTWDTIYYGYYPQTEIVSEKTQCGAAKNQKWSKESDYEVNTHVYQQLQSAKYTKNGDTVRDGVKYRRIRKEDSTFPATNGQDIPHYYFWMRSMTYHYFRYEPIRWRVLNTANENALLLADVSLDDQLYNKEAKDVTWELSSLRSWLNGYGEDKNKNFKDTAFREKEQQALVNTSLQNLGNLHYDTVGGSDTEDQIFLLAEMEVYGGAQALTHGFIANYRDGDPGARDEARRSKSSTYAKAMGVWSNYEDGFIGNCLWWTRSPGQYQNYAAYVCNYGFIRNYGELVDRNHIGVRPSLIIDLSDESNWSYGGTVCSNGEQNLTEAPALDVFADQKMDYVDEPDDSKKDDDKKDDDKKDDSNEKPQPAKIKISSVKVTSALSKKITAGKSVQLKASVAPAKASNKTVAWTTSNKNYATVNSKGLVKTLAAGKGKTVTITATAKDGSKKKASIRLSILKDRVKSISMKGPKTLVRGKSSKLKTTVKTTGKKANKTLRYTSSNPKYIKVSSSGKVTVLKNAKKGASVKITAMALDGTNKKASVKIKVK